MPNYTKKIDKTFSQGRINRNNKSTKLMSFKQEFRHEIMLLKTLLSEFKLKFGIQVKLAFELEFYLYGPNFYSENQNKLFEECYKYFEKNNIKSSKIYPENSIGQFEISIEPQLNPLKAVTSLIKVKDILTTISSLKKIKINFNAKPFNNLSGSALHTNISLHDMKGNNLFRKLSETDDEPKILKYAIAGLCETMIESMIFFAPNTSSYNRFKRYPKSEKIPYDFSPVKVCWGANNRTTAIRIPTSTINPESRHIEHRVPCADANPIIVINALLYSIRLGIENKLELKYNKVYGNAFEKQFDFPYLPKNKNDALFEYNNGMYLKSFIENSKILCQN